MLFYPSALRGHSIQRVNFFSHQHADTQLISDNHQWAHIVICYHSTTCWVFAPFQISTVLLFLLWNLLHASPRWLHTHAASCHIFFLHALGALQQTPHTSTHFSALLYLLHSCLIVHYTTPHKISGPLILPIFLILVYYPSLNFLWGWPLIIWKKFRGKSIILIIKLLFLFTVGTDTSSFLKVRGRV